MSQKHPLYKTAKIMFFEQLKKQKEIAKALNISEKTISNWAKKENWETERTAKSNTVSKRAEDIKAVIAQLTERRLEMFEEQRNAEKDNDKNTSMELKREAVGIGQEIAMHTKALQQMDKENKISLSVYLEVMDNVFKAMQAYDGNLYMQTLDFQEKHLSNTAQLIG